MFWNTKLFTDSEGVAVDVLDVEAARRWYAEKLGLGFSSTKVEEATMVLGYSAKEPVIYLSQIVNNERPDRSSHPPIMEIKHMEKAHEYLSSRNVDVGPIETDSGGNRIFRFRDLEGNEIEICQDH